MPLSASEGERSTSLEHIEPKKRGRDGDAAPVAMAMTMQDRTNFLVALKDLAVITCCVDASELRARSGEDPGPSWSLAAVRSFSFTLQ